MADQYNPIMAAQDPGRGYTEVSWNLNEWFHLILGTGDLNRQEAAVLKTHLI